MRTAASVAASFSAGPLVSSTAITSQVCWRLNSSPSAAPYGYPGPTQFPSSAKYRAKQRRFVCRRFVSEILADAAHLAEDGRHPAVFALLVGDHVGDGVDQRQVGERLGEVAEVAAGVRLQLLRVEVEPAGGFEQPFAEPPSP